MGVKIFFSKWDFLLNEKTCKKLVKNRLLFMTDGFVVC